VRAILSYGFYFVLSYYYLAGLLKISICPKGFLLWPLVGTEKVESSHLALVGIKSLSFCLYIFFLFFMDSDLLTSNMTTKVVSYSFLLFYFSVVDYQIQNIIVRVFSRNLVSYECWRFLHFPRVISPWETEFSLVYSGH
jgi:hypothetical protein